MEKIKKNYYDYIDLINKKNKKKNNFTFEQFYAFHLGAIRYAKRKNLNLNKILIEEKFYLSYANTLYFYNEEGVVDALKNKASNVINKAKETVNNVKETVASAGQEIYKQMAGLSALIANYLKTIGLAVVNASKELLKIIYDWHVNVWKKILLAIDIINNIKSKIIGFIEKMITDMIAKLAGVATNDKEAVKNALNKKQSEIDEYFSKNPNQRLAMGCILAVFTCYMMIQGASTGNPFMDFNVGIFNKLISSSIALSEAIKLNDLVDMITFFIVNKIDSITRIAPDWFGTVTNLTVMGGMFLTGALIKAIDKSNSPALLKIKKNVCQFLNKPMSLGQKMSGDILKLFKSLGSRCGIIDVNSDIGASCPI